jgi:pimeloyl-ACP methyl ester carboxylesterase
MNQLTVKYIVSTICIILFTTNINVQNSNEVLKYYAMDNCEILKTESHIAGLKISLIHKKPPVLSNDYAVLFLHGSSFPAALSFDFKMNGYSWMDNVVENGYDAYALDFLGYGNADRYPEMESNTNSKPVGKALEVYKDVDKAINLIIQRTGKTKVYLVGHSWGGSVAALYAIKYPHKVAKLVLYAAITQRNDSSAIQNIESAFEMMTPDERVTAMKKLTPEKKSCQLEPEIFTVWGSTWLQSDMLASKFKSNCVRFPAGPSADVVDMMHNRSYYSAVDIIVPVLVIRGEWDKYPNNTDDEKLVVQLENAPYKKYVVIEKATHVMHLEKSRYQLYDETLRFLKVSTNSVKD